MDPSTAPLVCKPCPSFLFLLLFFFCSTALPHAVWYQGGPGCSGLGGLLTENGPFVPNAQGGLSRSSIAWTDIANVVYLEQPAFVGFSYSNTSSDSNTGDARAAADNYAFVTAFIEAFPDYQGRSTWFAGESYAGNYVPSLLNLVLSNPSTQIYKQMTGIMVGNPVMFCGTMQNLTFQVNGFYWHGLVSYSNYQAWFSNGCPDNQNSSPCQTLFTTITTQIGVIDQELKRRAVPQQPSLDPDDLYQDFCTGNGTLRYVETIPVNCVPLGQLVANYLNRADVQAAIHAHGPNGGKALTWTECTSAINYNITGASLIPLYAKFHKQKPDIEILVYSGDVDIATVPFFFTQPCLGELQAQNSIQWQPWFVNGQTAGYWEKFDLYTFATVKGGGHEAPQYQPLSAFNMFSRFLSTQTLHDPSSDAARLRFPEKVVTQGRVLRNLLRKQKPGTA